MEVGLDGHLKDQEDTKDFVAHTLVALLNLACEDIAKIPDAFGEVVVAAREVEGC